MAVIYLPPKGGAAAIGSAFGSGIGSGIGSMAQKLALQEIERQQFINGLLGVQGAQTARDTNAAQAGVPVDLAADPTPSGMARLLQLTQGGMDPRQAMLLQQQTTQEELSRKRLGFEEKRVGMEERRTNIAESAETRAGEKFDFEKNEIWPIDKVFKTLQAKAEQGKLDMQPLERQLKEVQIKQEPIRTALIEAQARHALSSAARDDRAAATEAARVKALQAEAQLNQQKADRADFFMKEFARMAGGGGGAAPPPAAGPRVQPQSFTPPAAGGGVDPTQQAIQEALSLGPGGAPAGGPVPNALGTSPDTVLPGPAGGQTPGFKRTQATGDAPAAQAPQQQGGMFGGLNLTKGEIMGTYADLAGLPASIGNRLAASDRPNWQLHSFDVAPGQKETVLLDTNARGGRAFTPVYKSDMRETGKDAREQQGVMRIDAILQGMEAIHAATKEGKSLGSGAGFAQLNDTLRQLGVGTVFGGDRALTKSWQTLQEQLGTTFDDFIKGTASDKDIGRALQTVPSLTNDDQTREQRLQAARGNINLSYKLIQERFESSKDKPLKSFDARVKGLGVDQMSGETVMRQQIPGGTPGSPNPPLEKAPEETDKGRSAGAQFGQMFIEDTRIDAVAKDTGMSRQRVIELMEKQFGKRK